MGPRVTTGKVRLVVAEEVPRCGGAVGEGRWDVTSWCSPVMWHRCTSPCVEGGEGVGCGWVVWLHVGGTFTRVEDGLGHKRIFHFSLASALCFWKAGTCV